jgi:hypothetical protein
MDNFTFYPAFFFFFFFSILACTVCDQGLKMLVHKDKKKSDADAAAPNLGRRLATVVLCSTETALTVHNIPTFNMNTHAEVIQLISKRDTNSFRRCVLYMETHTTRFLRVMTGFI